jgi:hypothetical protein
VASASNAIMSSTKNISTLIHRRDRIRDWLQDEAPFTEADQRHLDSDTPERAYWHHGYQAALTDVINLLADGSRPDTAGTPTSTRRGV